MRRFLAAQACLPFISLSAQIPRGTLRYGSGAHRVELQVIEGNHPAFIALRPEQGELAMLREFLLGASEFSRDKPLEAGLITV